MWAILKRKFTNKLYNTLEEVSEFITAATNSLDADKIKTTCGFPIYLRRIKLD